LTQGMGTSGIAIALSELVNTDGGDWWTAKFDCAAVSPYPIGGFHPNRSKRPPPMIGRSREHL
jgi:hypothetical protein